MHDRHHETHTTAAVPRNTAQHAHVPPTRQRSAPYRRKRGHGHVLSSTHSPPRPPSGSFRVWGHAHHPHATPTAAVSLRPRAEPCNQHSTQHGYHRIRAAPGEAHTREVRTLRHLPRRRLRARLHNQTPCRSAHTCHAVRRGQRHIQPWPWWRRQRARGCRRMAWLPPPGVPCCASTRPHTEVQTLRRLAG